MFLKFTMPPTLGLKALVDGLIRLLTETDTTLAEFGSSTTLLLCGALLLLPYDALSASPWPLGAAMLSVMSENLWGGLFLGLGIVQSVANLKRNVPWRRRTAFASAAVFGFIGMLGARVRPISLFGAMCKVQALVQVLVGLHLGVREATGER